MQIAACQLGADAEGLPQNGIAVDEREVDKLCAHFGAADGDLDWARFREVMARSQQPAEVEGGCSLVMKPSSFKSRRPEGRSRKFEGLAASWNNAYAQALDGDGRPAVSNVIEGRFVFERVPAGARAVQQHSRPGLVMDESKGQPLVKSLLQGEYYALRGSGRPQSAKVDYISHNRKMTRDYSRLVASTRPPSSATQRAGSAFGYVPLAATVTRPARARVVGQMPTPRTAKDLEEVWGRALDPRFAATTLAWLGSASDVEKTKFKNALFKVVTQFCAPVLSPMAPVAGCLLARRAPRSNPGALTACAPRQAPGRPASALGSELGEDAGARSARPLAARPSSRSFAAATPQLDGAALAAATAYRRARPASAASVRPTTAPRSATASARAIVSQRSARDRRQMAAEQPPELHSTIQRSAFGAAWAAPPTPHG